MTTLERVDFTPFVVVCRVNLHVPAVLGAARFTPEIRQPPVTVHLAVAFGDGSMILLKRVVEERFTTTAESFVVGGPVGTSVIVIKRERVDFTPFVVVCRVNLHVPAVLGATRFTPVIRQPPVTVHLAVALGGGSIILLKRVVEARFTTTGDGFEDGGVVVVATLVEGGATVVLGNAGVVVVTVSTFGAGSGVGLGVGSGVGSGVDVVGGTEGLVVVGRFGAAGGVFARANNALLVVD